MSDMLTKARKGRRVALEVSRRRERNVFADLIVPGPRI